MQNMLLLCLVILLSANVFGVVNCAPSAAAAVNDSNEATIIVKTKSGDLVGRTAKTLLDQRNFFSFQGTVGSLGSSNSLINSSM